ncbi:hypothetical protein [Terasakiella sp. SH-1]|uniref:hypothetical protein n=1 Tax=Terasakiella sp. SH-1 TaxID=2560057 RepID=UPI001072FE0E|nr:hypothetical protein [Terasakiella sp. SH-1]
MDITGLAAYSVGMTQASQKQDSSVAMVKQAVKSNTQAAQQLSQQAADQAKAASAQAVSAHKIDIVV